MSVSRDVRPTAGTPVWSRAFTTRTHEAADGCDVRRPRPLSCYRVKFSEFDNAKHITNGTATTNREFYLMAERTEVKKRSDEIGVSPPALLKAPRESARAA